MSRRAKIILLLVIGVAVLAFVFRSGFKRSIPGRIVRFVAGQPGAVQIAEDLAEDVRRKAELAGLQQWSTQALRALPFGHTRYQWTCLLLVGRHGEACGDRDSRFLKECMGA